MFRGAGKRSVNAGKTTIWQPMRNGIIGLFKGFADWLPLACIIVSVYAVFGYHSLFNDAILIAQAQATAEAQKGTLAGAFLIDIAAAERPEKVRLSNLVLFENRNTLVALDVENDKTVEGQRRNMEDTISEARPKAHRYGLGGSTRGEEALQYSETRSATSPGVPQPAEAATKLEDDFETAHKFLGGYAPVPSPDEVLKTKLVPLGNELMLWYLTIFVAAETAFILMALKEYLQDLAHISDLSLMGMDVQLSPQNSPN
jgi:hypothetical protein